MKHIENRLKQQLNHEDGLSYPDFNKMWSNIETISDADTQVNAPIEATDTAMMKANGAATSKKMRQHSGWKYGWEITNFRLREWRRAAALASLSVIIIAAPVYAALQMDWTHLLNHRSGIQAALAQNLGQTIEQSVTKDGVTLTIHSAIVDENRTVLLYSLDTGRYGQTEWKFTDKVLVDEKGQRIEGLNSTQKWDEETRRYIGYFESDWTPKSGQANIKLQAEQIQFFSLQSKGIPLDIKKSGEQQFAIEQDGINKVVAQVFPEGEDSLLLTTSIFSPQSQSEFKDWAFPEVSAYRNSEAPVPYYNGTFGTPGDQGEYMSQKTYKLADVQGEGTSFQLDYLRREATIDQQWTLPLHLNKQQMEAGTLRSDLDLLVPDTEDQLVLKELVITPTQIRVMAEHEERYFQSSFVKYELEVDGHILNSSNWYSEQGDYKSKLYAERPLDLEITESSTIKLIGRHHIERHDGGEYPPILLKNISSERQSFMQDIGGYPVKWTYYREDGNLFVETESADPLFGGVNQTHIGKGKDRIIGKPLTVNFSGDGNNKSIDVYKDYGSDSAEIYMFYYTTERPDEQFSIQLRL
ncbi:DUF4179 domain-containing protein [Paenibacillus massiliensis]|uniref:DUF4179 domain-containing protein n=1 Tax=Paenibacillus massiliensis TaxID=225917 RepID=UPI000425732D|nr:DUF4179 domain-containing protein [Paenibacillus massiliensis]